MAISSVIFEKGSFIVLHSTERVKDKEHELQMKHTQKQGTEMGLTSIRCEQE